MKLYQWICGAFLLGAVASCSSDDISGPDNNATDGEKTTGYLALKINLPQQDGSRATDGTDDNVKFDDGEAWEYGVNDAKLLLFTADNNKVADAKFYKSYTLNRAFSPTDPANDQITASSVEAVAVNFTKESTNIWALVMLNVPAGVSDPTENQLFSEYRTKVIDGNVNFIKKDTDNKEYIFMTNAPLSDVQGGANDPGTTPAVNTLVYLGTVQQAVQPSLQKAREKVAGCIYVERALAKFTATISNPTVTIKGNPGTDGEATDLGLKVDEAQCWFGLDHINKSSYVIRNVIDFPAQASLKEEKFSWNMTSPNLGTAYYRMIGNTLMPGYNENPVLHSGTKQKYRTYWCVDPNYETGLTEYDTTAETDMKVIGGKNAFYPKENTFTVEKQNYGNSTLAVFKITFTKDNSATDLFVINKQYDVVYTDVADATSNMYNYILSQDVIKTALKTSVKEGAPTGTDIDFAPYLGLTFERNPSDGIYKVTNIYLNTEADKNGTYYDEGSPANFNKVITKAVKDNLMDRVNTLYEITKYEGGVSYYAIPIKHFGDASTPWTAKTDQNQAVTGEAYPATGTYKYDSPSFLGRYGMVRNNWYELDVQSFKGLGYPVKPNFEDELDLSDDNNPVKKYIGVETHILSWAKRTQSVNF